ncbi:MAG: type IV secretion system protein [Alphaproteobacteria bacterium]|nr:type IV secretion system protein [Alphaproteobacteria bacterium]
MFKRKQQSVSDSAKHWYQDKYQQVLVQRNVLALLTLVALAVSLISVIAVKRMAPLKTVEPYLLQIDDRSGIVQSVNPAQRNVYAASEVVDRYFVSRYISSRESYNFSILRYNYDSVRVMSVPNIFFDYRRAVDPANPNSLAAVFKGVGQRDVKFASMSYIHNPPLPNEEVEKTPAKIMQARIIVVDKIPGSSDIETRYVVTITFEYAKLNLNQEEMLINPLGFQVLNYQIQKEIN